MHIGFWLGNLTEREHLEGLGVERRIILKLICKKQEGSVGWIDLAQDRNKCRDLF